MALTTKAPPDTLQTLKESLNNPFVFNKSSSVKPNVSFVYRVGVPSSLEAWVQEAGRGGRDGDQCKGNLKSYALIIFN